LGAGVIAVDWEASDEGGVDSCFKGDPGDKHHNHKLKYKMKSTIRLEGKDRIVIMGYYAQEGI
jgi:hypothetical protein